MRQRVGQDLPGAPRHLPRNCPSRRPGHQDDPARRQAFEKVLQYVAAKSLMLGSAASECTVTRTWISAPTPKPTAARELQVMISNKKYVRPSIRQAEYTIAWTEEALRRMERIPVFARGVARTAIPAMRSRRVTRSSAIPSWTPPRSYPAERLHEAMKQLGATWMSRDRPERDEG